MSDYAEGGLPERHAPYRVTTEAERIALDVAARVVQQHEPRRMACACGDPMGDSIDYRWHLANQTALAVADRLAATSPIPPGQDH